ncbi:unnamed protein product [Urochloa decumbens]|uniref:KIB1-4 beta-propeller domain-containing protein n=1 Tax=Urochloa decumbens TaxID=240449 RepID=A0ABC9E9C9_9POAL
MSKPQEIITPCLFLPGDADEKATVLSMAEGESSSTSDLAMRGGSVIIGSSSDGWLVTADDRGALRMANPATGSHADLPPITTLPFLSSSCCGNWFCLDVHSFLQVRFAGAPPPPDDTDWGHDPPTTYTLTAAQMRQRFYRKVVLSSSSPPPPGSNTYAAMLLTDRHVGAPAFATAADPSWRMAPSPDGVEDAIYYGGRFVSITYAGHVEAWRRDTGTGEFTSEAAAPRLDYANKLLRRKYLAAAPDGGQLMAVLKHSKEQEEEEGYGSSRGCKVTRVFFKVLVLDQASGRWEEAAEDIIGGAALFVGVNASVRVPARERRGISAGRVYFTDDEVGGACMRHARGAGGGHQRSSYDGEPADDTELQEAGVYSLKTGKVERIAGEHPRWPPPAWFTPSFP